MTHATIVRTTQRGFVFGVLDDSGDDVFIHAAEFEKPAEFDAITVGSRVKIAKLEHKPTKPALAAKRVSLA